ncbi:MAG: CUB domain-containing protein [Candidatus Thiodiazotropha sp.]
MSNNTGFITSPNYPAETPQTCKWRIRVPADHYAHIFLHEVSI